MEVVELSSIFFVLYFSLKNNWKGDIKDFMLCEGEDTCSHSTTERVPGISTVKPLVISITRLNFKKIN